MGKYNISEAEWRIMDCLWSESNLTLKQIVENIDNTEWSYTTIRTMVKRLMDKGVIGADKAQSSNFKYFTLAEEKDCKIEEAKSFLSRVFGGSVSMMVSTLAKQEVLSKKEVAELKKIIEGMEGKES